MKKFHSLGWVYKQIAQLGNPPRMRRKGGGGAPLFAMGFDKFKRKANKCGLCGIVGHNRQSCHIRSESLTQSQNIPMESFQYGDENFDEDEDGCNIDMVCIINFINVFAEKRLSLYLLIYLLFI